ncbi:hypothetical protein [Streptomyces lasiicapitis]|uniref:Uncharacterized protein n=1 Tax=Streptomyces lasiicapitis TaxID=1923961 RepID=A0ABQ2LIL2_9ACTN|nr:hypothetical protein [Streptomyces lasiicapitis]GGO35649.1 hypothetical protein GCM10012286_06660 [Streptomyces lasiicapitis]
MDRYFWHLTTRQANGLDCVVCEADLHAGETSLVPVGMDPATKFPVYACKQPCAVSVAVEAERMARDMRIATGTESDSADAGLIGRDNEFGALLRDMRLLVGMDALLAVTSDLPTLMYLLQMTDQHAESAHFRARAVWERMSRPNPDQGQGDGGGGT